MAFTLYFLFLLALNFYLSFENRLFIHFFFVIFYSSLNI